MRLFLPDEEKLRIKIANLPNIILFFKESRVLSNINCCQKASISDSNPENVLNFLLLFNRKFFFNCYFCVLKAHVRYLKY